MMKWLWWDHYIRKAGIVDDSQNNASTETGIIPDPGRLGWWALAAREYDRMCRIFTRWADHWPFESVESACVFHCISTVFQTPSLCSSNLEHEKMGFLEALEASAPNWWLYGEHDFLKAPQIWDTLPKSRMALNHWIREQEAMVSYGTVSSGFCSPGNHVTKVTWNTMQAQTEPRPHWNSQHGHVCGWHVMKQVMTWYDMTIEVGHI